MLESGVKIEGLAGDSTNNDVSKKDSRTNKKKKQKKIEATDGEKSGVNCWRMTFLKAKS